MYFVHMCVFFLFFSSNSFYFTKVLISNRWETLIFAYFQKCIGDAEQEVKGIPKH